MNEFGLLVTIAAWFAGLLVGVFLRLIGGR
jgi:hypothetical protein